MTTAKAAPSKGQRRSLKSPISGGSLLDDSTGVRSVQFEFDDSEGLRRMSSDTISITMPVARKKRFTTRGSVRMNLMNTLRGDLIEALGDVDVTGEEDAFEMNQLLSHDTARSSNGYNSQMSSKQGLLSQAGPNSKQSLLSQTSTKPRFLGYAKSSPDLKGRQSTMSHAMSISKSVNRVNDAMKLLEASVEEDEGGGEDDRPPPHRSRRALRRQSSAVRYSFLEAVQDKKEVKEVKSSMIVKSKWWHGVFFFSVASALACLITLWAKYPTGARMPTEMVASTPWSNGCKDGLNYCICPRETICADDILSMVFLTIARTIAWFDYPLYMLLFISKANNLNNYMQGTWLRVWMNFSDYHHVHRIFGIIVLFETTTHSFFHILRWARRNDDIKLLVNTNTGITGLIALILGPLIVLPMLLPVIKKKLDFEIRKGLHYLSLVWGLAMVFHAPQRIYWLFGTALAVYFLDKLFEMFNKTYLIESALFERLSDSTCLITFENPPGWDEKNAAYTYLMLPWISRTQYHAFTVFPSSEPNKSCICISKAGEWTTELIGKITLPAHRPAYVAGPYISPFSSPAMDCENLVIVGSGIGITPAISIIKQYNQTSRRLNLVWMCKDAGLVEHFLSDTLNYFGGLGFTLIYYTGKRELVLDEEMPANVFIFNGRPNLENTISGIIYSIASGKGLPEELNKNAEKISKAPPGALRCSLLIKKALSIYSVMQLFSYAVKASNLEEDEESHELVADREGTMYILHKLLQDDIDYVIDDIDRSFDSYGSTITIDQFEDLLVTLEEGSHENEHGLGEVNAGLKQMKRTKTMFQSKEVDAGLAISVRRHLKGTEGSDKFIAKTWSMLYCGGSEAIHNQLRDYKRKYKVGLAVEKFDW